MRVLNIGSLNIDEVFRVRHFVRPGETIACNSYGRFPGGKGSNQSIALARAGARVFHAGKIGKDGSFLRDLLVGSGADCSLLLESEVPTGRAIIQVNEEGQNCILLFGGANQDIGREDIDRFLAGWGRGDAVLLQNEISEIDYAVTESLRRGLEVFLNPSPFGREIAELPLGRIACIIVNEVEGESLTGENDSRRMVAAFRSRYPETNLVLTLGAEGVFWSGTDGRELRLPAKRVPVVDTTAAGDTFTGYLIAALARGLTPERALDEGLRAAAICVSRMGAASSIPLLSEIG
jgi:ribokinase